MLSHTTMSAPMSSSSPSSTVSSPSAHRNTPSTIRLKALLRETLRITVIDGRIFLGTFVGTDSLLNVLLINTEEFRLSPEENWNGRFVGQVLIPWKLVVKVEALGQQDPEEPDDLSSLYF
jgi:small nuclear ribonucleoprotein (snRNP)-like protein